MNTRIQEDENQRLQILTRVRNVSINFDKKMKPKYYKFWQDFEKYQLTLLFMQF